jgi:hypothetical protein
MPNAPEDVVDRLLADLEMAWLEWYEPAEELLPELGDG